MFFVVGRVGGRDAKNIFMHHLDGKIKSPDMLNEWDTSRAKYRQVVDYENIIPHYNYNTLSDGLDIA